MHLLMIISFLLCQPTQADSAPVAPTTRPAIPPRKVPPPPPAMITNMINDLSDPDSHLRELATVTLMEMGPECYAPLRAAFDATPLYDVRRRIRQIALELYLTEHLGPPKAFLGISHRGVPVVESSDARIPPWATALYVTDVFKASSAQRAGLQSGDLVMALNGQPGTLEHPAIEFTRWIGEQAPGSQCEVAILRGGAGHKVVPEPRGGFSPASFAQAEVEAVDHARDARVPPGVGGIILRRVRGVPVELDVQDGDLILALDEESIPSEGTEQRYRDWVGGTWKGKGMQRVSQRQGVQLGRAPQQVVQQLVQTAHVLRGGEGQKLTVALGRWPTYLSDQVQGAPRAADVGQREHVIETFGSWWRETFDPAGRFSERADLSPDWQLDPDRQVR